MRSRIIIITLIITLAGIEVYAQSDSLMTRLLSLEREIMRARSDSSRAAQLLFTKAMVLKEAQEYDQSLFTMNRMSAYRLSDSNRCVLHFQTALVRYLNKDYTSSLYDLWSAQECGVNSKEAQILSLMLLLENERWDDFRKSFLEAASHTAVDTSVFLREFQTPTYYDAELYDRYSKVPARGLFKLGMRRQGLTNVTLQVVFAGLTVYEVYSGFYSTAFFSGLRPVQRFYNGGRNLTQGLVRYKNQQAIARQKQAGYRYIGQLNLN